MHQLNEIFNLYLTRNKKKVNKKIIKSQQEHRFAIQWQCAIQLVWSHTQGVSTLTKSCGWALPLETGNEALTFLRAYPGYYIRSKAIFPLSQLNMQNCRTCSVSYFTDFFLNDYILYKLRCTVCFEHLNICSMLH